jgi:hypothetical protein
MGDILILLPSSNQRIFYRSLLQPATVDIVIQGLIFSALVSTLAGTKVADGYDNYGFNNGARICDTFLVAH